MEIKFLFKNYGMINTIFNWEAKKTKFGSIRIRMVTSGLLNLQQTVTQRLLVFQVKTVQAINAILDKNLASFCGVNPYRLQIKILKLIHLSGWLNSVFEPSMASLLKVINFLIIISTQIQVIREPQLKQIYMEIQYGKLYFD